MTIDLLLLIVTTYQMICIERLYQFVNKAGFNYYFRG
ncbi:Uncharacterised protein [Pragia fontium]|nr:Uncharacterised protein [Pragia fontium]VEJ54974.1 Uncharacterised protein [Pragia fontium]